VQVSRHQQFGDFALQRSDRCRQVLELGLCECDHLFITRSGEFPRPRQLGFGAGKRFGRAHDRRQPGVFAAEGLQSGRIGGDRRIGQLPGDLLRPRERLAESDVHRSGLRGCVRGSILPAESIDSAGGVDQALLPGEVRMALGAHFDADGRGRRAGLEGIAALTLYGDSLVDWMQIGLHGLPHSVRRSFLAKPR
jgi:hypothetical protein